MLVIPLFTHKMAVSLTAGATAHGRLILAWAITGHHWLQLQASYDKLSPRVKLLALSGLSLCIQQRCVLGNLDPVYRLCPRIGRRHLLQRGLPCIDVLGYIPLGILHGETAWWLTSSMNGRASSYLYKHLQQTNMMHHKRPCGQPCVPRPVAFSPCHATDAMQPRLAS